MFQHTERYSVQQYVYTIYNLLKYIEIMGIFSRGLPSHRYPMAY